jgi:predicted hotdog family 3-hydroxylacyl-ACP dehydratase
MLERIALCELIPHAGGMCLLDEVLSWDSESVVCRTRSHRRMDNPLRHGDALAAIHAIEYGAQAMAVHGGLLAKSGGGPLRGGYLVSVRNVDLSVQRLDLIEAPLSVRADRLLADAGNLLYRFEITADTQLIAKGKAAVMARPEETP